MKVVEKPNYIQDRINSNDIKVLLNMGLKKEIIHTSVFEADFNAKNKEPLSNIIKKGVLDSAYEHIDDFLARDNIKLKQENLIERLMNGKNAREINGVLLYTDEATKIVEKNNIRDAMKILDLYSSVAIYEIADCGTDVYDYVVNCSKIDLDKESYQKLLVDTVDISDGYSNYIKEMLKSHTKEDILESASDEKLVFSSYYNSEDSEDFVLITNEIFSRVGVCEKWDDLAKEALSKEKPKLNII